MSKGQTATEYLIIMAIVIIIALIVIFAMEKDPFSVTQNRERTENLTRKICEDYGFQYEDYTIDSFTSGAYVKCNAITQIDNRNITIPVYIFIDWEYEKNKTGWYDEENNTSK